MRNEYYSTILGHYRTLTRKEFGGSDHVKMIVNPLNETIEYFVSAAKGLKCISHVCQKGNYKF